MAGDSIIRNFYGLISGDDAGDGVTDLCSLNGSRGWQEMRAEKERGSPHWDES